MGGGPAVGIRERTALSSCYGCALSLYLVIRIQIVHCNSAKYALIKGEKIRIQYPTSNNYILEAKESNRKIILLL